MISALPLLELARAKKKARPFVHSLGSWNILFRGHIYRTGGRGLRPPESERRGCMQDGVLLGGAGAGGTIYSWRGARDARREMREGGRGDGKSKQGGKSWEMGGSGVGGFEVGG